MIPRELSLTEPTGGAAFSECERYRYHLFRMAPLPPIDPANPLRARVAGRGRVLFVMCNPSTADGTENDPTIRRCIGFASSWGFDRLDVANVNPYRATDPRKMLHPDEEALAANDYWIDTLARQCAMIVAAWGTVAPADLADRALRILREHRDVHVLGLTDGGLPRHPLYVAGHTVPLVWQERQPWAAR